MRAMNGIAAQRYRLPVHLALVLISAVAMTVGAIIAMHAIAAASPHTPQPANGAVSVVSEQTTAELVSDVGHDHHHHHADCSDHDSLRERALTTVVFADRAPAMLATHIFLTPPDSPPVLPKRDQPPSSEVALVAELSVSRI
ncbi:hypothetical protein [Herbiconiux sp. YIM B11900]|uniref:hypothetical protein n=1 Tax=Herbiconiux sp. YIM B11900 TaxID=3404131 RepID=UPI003F85CFDA